MRGQAAGEVMIVDRRENFEDFGEELLVDWFIRMGDVYDSPS